MALGDEVTWRAWHFRIPWTMTARITEYERPIYFVDEQQRGPFHSWWHRHEFHPLGIGTEMVDHVRYRSPAGPLGSLADRLLLERHMIRLLKGRNEMIREIAEAN
jgi:ligand-binding SRPBCC domain-containing protein